MYQVAVLGGRIAVVEVPAPAVRSGGVLVRTSHSLIGADTESAGASGGGRLLTSRAKRYYRSAEG